MNNKVFLFLFLCGSLFTIEAKNQLNTQANKGQCYCSFVCGPRDADQEGDAPSIDPETGIFFCQERDRIHYFKRGCHRQHNAKIYNSYCAQQEQLDEDEEGFDNLKEAIKMAK